MFEMAFVDWLILFGSFLFFIVLPFMVGLMKYKKYKRTEKTIYLVTAFIFFIFSGIFMTLLIAAFFVQISFPNPVKDLL